MKPTLRLEDCGDWLTLQQFMAWSGRSERSIRRDLRTGDHFVQPASLKPLLWRRVDCEAKLHGASLVADRKKKARARLSSAAPTRSRATATQHAQHVGAQS